ADEIDAPAVARDRVDRAALPLDDVVELEASDEEVNRLRQVLAVRAPATQRQVVHIGEGEAMTHVRVGVAALKLGAERVVRAAVARACAVPADAAGRVVDGVRPGVARNDREAARVALL